MKIEDKLQIARATINSLKDENAELLAMLKNRETPLTKAIKTICPITQLRLDGPFPCCENQCAWWQTFYKGTGNEYSECAIKSLTCLQDIAYPHQEG